MHTGNPCADCDGASRRDFLAGLLTTLGLCALPVAYASGLAAGSERRYPMPGADGVTIDRGAQVILVRFQSHVYAFNLACPHENTALKWLPKDGRFQCPKHDSKYQPNGTFMDGRATRNMDRLGIRREDRSVVVDLNRFFQSDKDPAGWAAATIAL
jgi:Rieske Fe-S protein